MLSSLRSTEALTGPLQRPGNAPLPCFPTRTRGRIRSFGGVLESRPLSARIHLTSELLRTLQRNGCFQANLLVVSANPHPFSLSTHLGALADGLGCFPLADGHYRSPTDSQGPCLGHSEFDWGR